MKRKSRKKIFNEIKKVFEDMHMEKEVNMARVEIALNELNEIENKYKPDWESVVMNTIMFIGVLLGTLSAEMINGIDDGDELREALNEVLLLLTKYYSNEQE